MLIQRKYQQTLPFRLWLNPDVIQRKINYNVPADYHLDDGWINVDIVSVNGWNLNVEKG